MTGDVEQPARLVDTKHIGLAKIPELPNGGLRIGVLARNSDAANHPLVRCRYPLLTQALLAGASPQLRNIATIGANLLQPTRCPYFTDSAFASFNNCLPGNVCCAREVYSRVHAILGVNPAGIAVHPSDMNVALAAGCRGPGDRSERRTQHLDREIPPPCYSRARKPTRTTFSRSSSRSAPSCTLREAIDSA